MFRAIKGFIKKQKITAMLEKDEQSTKQNHNSAGKVNQDKRLQYQE